jgi:hypothetical protein
MMPPAFVVPTKPNPMSVKYSVKKSSSEYSRFHDFIVVFFIKKERKREKTRHSYQNFVCPSTPLFIDDAACLCGADKAEADGDYGQHRSGAKSCAGWHLLTHLCLDLKQIHPLKKIFEEKRKDSVAPVR